MVGWLWPAANCIEVRKHLYRLTSALLSDSFPLNESIGGGLHERAQHYCDIDFQNISSLSTRSNSGPAYPVSSSSWFLQSWHQRYSDPCIWPWLGQSWSMTSRRLSLTYDETSSWWRFVIRGHAYSMNFFSLERHRLRGDLISAYNIFYGRLDLP